MTFSVDCLKLKSEQLLEDKTFSEGAALRGRDFFSIHIYVWQYVKNFQPTFVSPKKDNRRYIRSRDLLMGKAM